MELQTARLYLRPYKPEDATCLHTAKQASQPELQPWMPWAQKPSTVEGAAATIAHFQQRAEQDEEYPLAIFTHAGEFVGSTGYSPGNRAVPEYEVGYWLDTRHTGQGYMHEAVQALTAYLFGQKGANRVEIICNAANHRSAKVAKKMGFVQEAHLHNKRRDVKGELAAEKVFAHTPQSWQSFCDAGQTRSL